MKNLLMLLLFLTCCSLSYGQGNVVINGSVTDGNGNPIINESVTAIFVGQDSTYNTTLIFETDGNGFYEGAIFAGESEGFLFIQIIDCDGSSLVQNFDIPAGGIDVIADFLYCQKPSCQVYFSTEPSPFGNIVTAYPTGSPPFLYQWSNGENTQNIVINEHGNYCLTVTDANGCEASNCIQTDTIVIDSICLVDISLSYDPAGNPSLLAQNVFAPDIPTQFLWTASGETTPSISIDEPGTYCVVMTTEEGCVVESCYQYVGSDGCETYLYSEMNPIFGGTFLGTSNVGIAPFTYQWSNGSTEEFLLVNDTTGEYCVIVTDVTGCVAEACILLDTIDINPIDTFCYTQVHQVSITETEAVLQAYISTNTPVASSSYLWSTGETTPIITVTQEGEYCVTVTNDDGCESTGCYYVHFNNGPDSLCFVQIAQTIDAAGNQILVAFDVFFPDTEYTYSWGTGATTPSIIVVEEGIYCVVATNVLTGCISESCFTYVAQPDCGVELICDPVPGVEGVSLQTNAFGVMPFTYEWSTNESTETIVVNEPGDYCVTVTDATGCVAAACMVVDSIVIWPVDTLCYAQIAPISIEGGEAVLQAYVYGIFGNEIAATYEWSTGETTDNIAVTEVGEYCVTATTVAGCVNTNCIVLTFDPNPTDSCFVIIHPDYNDDTIYELTAEAFGEGPFTYFWSNGQEGPAIIIEESGEYCVEAITADGCVASSCFYVQLDNNPVDSCGAWIESSNPFYSVPTTLTVGGWGTAPFSYDWGNGFITQSLEVTEPGVYCVTVMDAAGCASIECVEIYHVVEPEDCSVTIFAADSAGVQFLIALPSGGISPYTFEWSDGTTNQYTIAPGAGVYTVTITDATGCQATTVYEVISNNPGTDSLGIFGNVFAFAPDIDGYVLLIEYSETDGTLSIIDSTEIESSPNQIGGTYLFSNVGSGNYLLKAVLNPGSNGYEYHLPTYYGDALFWNEAAIVTIPNVGIPEMNITMSFGENNGGPGFIGGLVAEGANFNGSTTREEGDPIANASILLLDEMGEAVMHTATNANGRFGFGDLPWGTYKVYLEMMGLDQAHFTITIGPDSPTNGNLIFDVHSTGVITSLEEVLNANEITIAPNPVVDQLNVSLTTRESADAVITITSINGQQLYAKAQRLNVGEQTLTIDMSSLPSGLYFLNIINGKEVITNKIVKQ